MALILRNRAGRLLRLRGAVVGSWLYSHLSTSTMLPQTSKSSSDHDTKIYELRTYYVKPKAFGKKIIIIITITLLLVLLFMRCVDLCFQTVFPHYMVRYFRA